MGNGNSLIVRQLLIDRFRESLSVGRGRNTTIWDIPHVFWAKFFEVCIGQENALLNACLSSANVELAITRDSTRMKMRLRGEKVFSILVLHYYIDKEELLRCYRTKCEDLKGFVVSSYWIIEFLASNSFLRKSIRFSNLQKINQFCEKAKQSENKWELFRNKRFIFDRRTTTEEERNSFWIAATAFMKTFGAYIVDLKINDSFYEEQMQNFCTDLTIIMPRLRYFTWSDIAVTNHYLCMISLFEKRSIEPVLKILGFHHAFRYTKWYSILVQGCKRCEISNSEVLDLPEHGQELEQLVIRIPNTSLPYQKLLNADLSDFRNVTNLTLHGHNNIMVSIRLLRKFSNVSVLSLLDFGWELGFSDVYNFIRDSGASFPFVNKLTLELNSNPPFKLDILASLFPSLRQLHLRRSPGITSLDSLMADWKNACDLREDEVDVYQLYAQKRPLSHSNVWRYLKNLNVLCIQTLKIIEVVNDDAAGVPPSNKSFQRQEIYTRLDSGEIQTEDLILPYSHYWFE